MQKMTPPPLQFSSTAAPSSTAYASDPKAYSAEQEPVRNRLRRSIAPSDTGSNTPHSKKFYIGGLINGHTQKKDLKPGNYNGVIYGWSVTPPNDSASMQEREKRVKEYAYRVDWKIKDIESGKEGERNIKFQDTRQFMDPAGYFSAGLLAAGYDPHKKITVTFESYVGRGTPENLSASEKRTYYAWEIAAGALQHDKVERGGPINFNFMNIDPKDRSTVSDLESLGKSLQNRWETTVAAPMRDASGELAKRSGKADIYLLEGNLQSLRSVKSAFNSLSPEGQEAINRTLDKNGQVIIPNIYGYPLAGHAFIPYTPYDGDYNNRPNKGVMVDLKNGIIREIHGDKDFASWAKDHRDSVLKSLNAKDIQGGKDAHWPKAGEVLDNLISGENAHLEGYNNLFSDQSIPVSEVFNYTRARGADYQLKYGDLNNGIADKYQDINTKNSVWADQTEVFGSSQQSWKAAKEFWGNTFGYAPVIGNAGNIVFGIHDGIYGMTAEDRAGGNAAAVISGLQLALELAPGAGELGEGDLPSLSNTLNAERYNWRFNPETSDVELVRSPKASNTIDGMPAEPAPGGATGDIQLPPTGEVDRIRTSQSGKISQHAVPNGEQVIENAPRNAKGIYHVKGPAPGEDRWYIRYTDATGVPEVYEIKSNFKLSDNRVEIIDPGTRKQVMIVHSFGDGEWAPAKGDGGIRLPWRRAPLPAPSDEARRPANFATQFRDVEGNVMKGAEAVDQYLQINDGAEFDLATKNFRDPSGDKTKFNVNWSIDKKSDFEVLAAETAGPSEYGSSEYASPFIKDVRRNPYIINNGESRTEININMQLNELRKTGNEVTAETADLLMRNSIERFEAAIPDPELRARISEVAHQGATGPGVVDLNSHAVLKEPYLFSATDTTFQIDHDPSTNVTKVSVISKGRLLNPDVEPSEVKGVDVSIKRTFTIRESNELDSDYAIDKHAPTTLEIAVTPT
ncbi:hypothetical protein ACK129_12780 [Pseudomonas citrulli]|jgi:hypothetical protein|uniref:hypothetical protein n=1 Tax=Pseudomonas citrulli TaxID=3064347 RepID=UPI003AD5C179